MISERRWLEIASGDRHLVLGHAGDPSAEELEQTSEALRVPGVGNRLTVRDSQYYDQGRLEPLLVLPLTERRGATWEATRGAFLVAHAKALVQ